MLAGRLVRLIPEDPPDPQRSAIKALFNHRLPAFAPAARLEWLSIVEGASPLWNAISSAKKELIRSFLNTINLEIVKRARPSSTFDFSSASVGNLFLTGARLFSGSFESAVYLLATIGGVPDDVRVIPAINSNFSNHISAGLEDGSVVVGQNSISHPSHPTHLPDQQMKISPESSADDTDQSVDEASAKEDLIEDANLPGSLPTLRKQYISFSKATDEDLPARISRIWYINPYGHEIRPPPNPRVIEAVKDASAVIYSIGSLYTSIAPCLILRGVGEALKASPARYKILILNGSLDRETGPSTRPFDAVDFVEAIASAAESNAARTNGSIPWIRAEDRCSAYVTHIVHLEGEGTPKVDRAKLSDMGIDCLRLYGRKGDQTKGMRYDGKALSQALEAILGRKDLRADKSRRNTLEA